MSDFYRCQETNADPFARLTKMSMGQTELL